MEKTNYQQIFTNLLMVSNLVLLTLISWQLTQPLKCSVDSKFAADRYVLVK